MLNRIYYLRGLMVLFLCIALNTAAFGEVAPQDPSLRLDNLKHDLDVLRQFNGFPEYSTPAIDLAGALLVQASQACAQPKICEASMDQAEKLLAGLGFHDHCQSFYVAHSHIDFAWLWMWSETVYRVIPDTFKACLEYMDETPEFCFTQSSPGMYEVAEGYPEMMNKIKKYVAEGRWELVGGRWCEGDTNTISAEAAAREFLLGQEYYQDTFGKYATVGWEPDTFGHCWTMPQLLRQAGIQYYYHSRETRKPRTSLYWWEGPDGSRVLSYDAEASGGWYMGNVDNAVKDVLAIHRQHKIDTALTVYGVGNHGGAPSRAMITTGKKLGQDKALPHVQFATAETFFKAVEHDPQAANLPVYSGELNPIFSGCYTSGMNLKQRMHHAELLAQQMETFCLIANQIMQLPYPGKMFTRWWRDICWGHHHDTIGGTCIHPSHEQQVKWYDAILSDLEALRQDRLERVMGEIHGRRARMGEGLVVVNTLGWQRPGVVAVKASWPGLVRADGAPVPIQPDGGQLLAFLDDIPAMGYGTWYEGTQSALPAAPVVVVATDQAKMQNERLRVTIDLITGRIASLFDRKLQKELAQPGAGVGYLQVNTEYPVGMSAWEPGQIYKSVELCQPAGIQILETGPVRGRIAVTYKYRASTITQHYILEAGSDALQFETHVDWQQVGSEYWKDKSGEILKVDAGEGRGLAKYLEEQERSGKLTAEMKEDGMPRLDVGFRLNLKYGKPNYGIPFGDVERDFYQRKPNEAFMSKVHEGPGPHYGSDYSKDWPKPDHAALLNWVAVDDSQTGLALMTMEPHGVLSATDELSLVLLRGYLGPDHDPARGQYVFKYQLMSYAGHLPRTEICRASAQFQAPLMAIFMPSGGATKETPLDRYSLVEVDTPNFIMTGAKMAERGADWVARAYNCDPEKGSQGTLQLPKPCALQLVDILERPQTGEMLPAAAKQAINIKPYVLQTYALKPQ